MTVVLCYIGIGTVGCVEDQSDKLEHNVYTHVSIEIELRTDEKWP